jgi:hypothetical protein
MKKERFLESKEELLSFNRRGLFAAPDETEEMFFRRCQASSPVVTNLSPRAKELFDIEPDWLKVIYDNKGLRLWEGGCTWIEADRVTLQLDKTFLKKESHFGYKREEIVAHELVHVVRGSFEEPIFEEVLAYQTSHSSFRRYFGPIFRTPKETLLLMGLIVGYGVASFFEMLQIPLISLFTATLLFGLLRLFRTQTIFAKAKKRLQSLISQQAILPVMLRLTDREIIRFSKMTPDEILSYAQKMTKVTLRWQQLFFAYFQQ